MVEKSRPDVVPEASNEGSQLCLSCGLCCRGLLHDHAPLETNEVGLAEGIGLPVRREGPDLSFALPCPLYKEDRCSVYPNRPKVCGRYQCELLERFQEGKTSLEEALMIVQSAKDLIAAIENQIGPSIPSQSVWQQIADFTARRKKNRDPEDFRTEHAQLLLDEKQLAFVCRHFETDESMVTRRESVVGAEKPSIPKGSVVPHPSVLFGDTAGQIVLSNTETGEYCALTGVAADMWRTLLEHDDMDDVVTALLRQYDTDEATLRSDLEGFVGGLVDRGLVKRNE